MGRRRNGARRDVNPATQVPPTSPPRRPRLEKGRQRAPAGRCRGIGRLTDVFSFLSCAGRCKPPLLQCSQQGLRDANFRIAAFYLQRDFWLVSTSLPVRMTLTRAEAHTRRPGLLDGGTPTRKSPKSPHGRVSICQRANPTASQVAESNALIFVNQTPPGRAPGSRLVGGGRQNCRIQTETARGN
jgi:hypothetical protein